MGCIASKNTVSITPAFDNSSSLQDQGRTSFSSHWSRSKSGDADRTRKTGGLGRNGVSEESVKGSTNGNGSLSFRLSNLHRYIEGEQVAAGWPFWLSAVAGEAIHGWVPLKSDSFEKLEKIGQGTYSCVFRARNVDTGKIVALKKVRFDNFEPESVRFMAREIQILRRLDHPNIVKLEGLITSRLSSSIYLVFEYMEHDLAGMVAFPEIKFSESQVKCYMHQLLLGLEHCHSHGVIHRDIKGANLLVNNEGILKIADFGLANFYSPGQRKPLTSRVVTLWYRPPELLLGSTNYVASVDLWSVGCVFAELLFGKPILQGRTEVEQLHKIFKLCGSPPEEYWRKSKLPHATIFKPQHRYEGSLRQICRDLPVTAIGLIETFLSVEPYKRGTALSALKSEYFMTKPYACDPSSLPVYPPSKEIDAKIREESHRKGVSSKGRAMGAARRPRTLKPEPSEGSGLYTGTKESGYSHRFENNHIKQGLPNRDGKTRLLVELQPMAEVNSRDEDLCINQISPRDIPFSGPLEVSTSSGFAWAKRRGGDNTSLRSNGRPSLKLRTSSMLDPMYPPHARNALNDPVSQQGHEPSKDQEFISNGSKSYQTTKRALLKQWTQLGRPESFDASGVFHSQDFSEAYYLKDEMPSTRSTLKNEAYHADGEDKVEFSGPLLCQSHKVDELLEKHERHIRQAMRRSLFHRERKYGKYLGYCRHHIVKTSDQFLLTKSNLSSTIDIEASSIKHLERSQLKSDAVNNSCTS